MCVVRCTRCRCAVRVDSRCSLSKIKEHGSSCRELCDALCAATKNRRASHKPQTECTPAPHAQRSHTSAARACVATHHGAHTRAASPHYSGPSAEKQPALRVASRVQSTVRRHMRRSCAHASPLSKVSLIVVCPLAAWPTPRAPCVLAAIICTHLESHRSHLVSPALAYYWRVCSYFFSPEASSFLTSS